MKDNKKQLPGLVKFFIKVLQVILYIPIQIVFIPITVIGFIDAIIKEFRISRKLDISFTAVQALQYRWMMHYFETREDPLSVAFIRKFPCESHFGLLATFGPLIIAQRCFGLTTKFGKFDEPGKEGYNSIVGKRVLMFDEIIEKHVDEMDQIVIPGSGFDLLALKLTKDKKAKVFEIDQANTLNLKVDTLEKADLEHDWITYIPVDFEKESWADKLIEAGFDKKKKTLFLWQSVSLYLEEDTVKNTLNQMSDLCVKGSIVAQDLYSKAFAAGKTSGTVKKSSDVMGNQGEVWKFGVDMSDDPRASVASFLSECGLKMTEFYIFGEKLEADPIYCIVEAEKYAE